jgi:hypothetical protein
LRDASAVPLTGDVQPPQLYRFVTSHTYRRFAAPQLCVTSELIASEREQRSDAGICKLATLLERAVRLSQVERDVLGVVVRGERVTKGPGRQFGKTDRVR